MWVNCTSCWTNNMEIRKSLLPVSETPPEVEGTTFFKTCINGINALSGVGLLSISFALSQGGWLSLMILLVVAVIFYYTGLLLQRCMESNPCIRSYPDIGALAFGTKGRALVSTFIYLELYLVAVEFLILEGDNLDKVFPSQIFRIGAVKIEGNYLFMMVTAVVILPTTWLKDLESLAYVSFGGVLASVVLVLCVAWAAAFDVVGFSQREDVVLKVQGLPTTVSLFAFCYCAHPVFPTLRTSMRDPTQFSKVLLICFVASTMCYGLMAILGYLMFGRNIESQITLNLPVDKTNTKVAILTALINPVAKYAAIINPIAKAIEEVSPQPITYLKTIIVRTLLLITTLVVAMCIPFFEYVMAFIGASLNVTTSILIPCLCYLKINETARRFGWELPLIVGIMMMGVFVGLVGTYSSLNDIVQHL